MASKSGQTNTLSRFVLSRKNNPVLSLVSNMIPSLFQEGNLSFFLGNYLLDFDLIQWGIGLKQSAAGRVLWSNQMSCRASPLVKIIISTRSKKIIPSPSFSLRRYDELDHVQLYIYLYAFVISDLLYVYSPRHKIPTPSFLANYKERPAIKAEPG